MSTNKYCLSSKYIWINAKQPRRLPLAHPLHMAGTPNPRIQIHPQAFRSPLRRKARQRANFAPPQPDYPAASVRDFLSAALSRPWLCSAGTARISISTSCCMRWRCRGGKGGVEGQMPPDHPHGVQEGQTVWVTAGLAAGLIDQLTQRKLDQQQAVDLLLD